MNRRGFLRGIGTSAAAVAGAAAVGAAETPPAVESAALVVRPTCPLCGAEQPIPQAAPGTPLPDHFKSMRRVQVAICYREACGARFAVRWVGDAAR